jgi:hypothetical protein
MIPRSILPAVITLCLVKAIGNARVTHIFPFIAACQYLSLSSRPMTDEAQIYSISAYLPKMYPFTLVWLKLLFPLAT